MKTFFKKLFKWIVVLILILFFLRAIFIYLFFIDPFRGKAFHQDTWLAYNQLGNKDSQCTRGAMVSDLKRHYLIKGIAKDSVLQLLGKAEIEQEGCLEYSLGMCSGFQVDYDGLYICFDSNNQLTNSFTKQH